jgi:hypothetical protein
MAPLSVAVHLQNDFDNCGEACAQMVIAFLTQTVTTSQDGLAQFKVTHEKGWFTSPGDLCAMINAGTEEIASGLPQYHVHAMKTRTDAMNYALTVLLSSEPVPVVALVDGDAHWVVLTGATSGRLPAILFRDPQPPRDTHVSSGIDAHAKRDQCRRWDLEFLDETAAGEAEFRDCSSWSAWFNGAKRAPVARRFVVLGPEVSSVKKLFTCPSAPLVPLLAGDTPTAFPAASFADAITRGLESRGLLAFQSWARLAGQDDGRLRRSARLVRVVDEGPVSAYYLLPLFDPDGRPAGAVGLDAQTGELLWGRLGLAEDYLVRLFIEPIPADDNVQWVWGVFRETFESPFFPLVRSGPVDQLRYWRALDRRTLPTLTPTR